MPAACIANKLMHQFLMQQWPGGLVAAVTDHVQQEKSSLKAQTRTTCNLGPFSPTFDQHDHMSSNGIGP